MDTSAIQWYAVVRRLAAFSKFLILCSLGTPTFRQRDRLCLLGRPWIEIDALSTAIGLYRALRQPDFFRDLQCTQFLCTSERQRCALVFVFVESCSLFSSPSQPDLLFDQARDLLGWWRPAPTEGQTRWQFELVKGVAEDLGASGRPISGSLCQAVLTPVMGCTGHCGLSSGAILPVFHLLVVLTLSTFFSGERAAVTTDTAEEGDCSTVKLVTELTVASTILREGVSGDGALETRGLPLRVGRTPNTRCKH